MKLPASPKILTDHGSPQVDGRRNRAQLKREVGSRVTDRARLALEVFNLLDSDVSDIDYFYTSRLPGEPLGGVDDNHLHPSLPRAARLTLQVSF